MSRERSNPHIRRDFDPRQKLEVRTLIWRGEVQGGFMEVRQFQNIGRDAVIEERRNNEEELAKSGAYSAMLSSTGIPGVNSRCCAMAY